MLLALLLQASLTACKSFVYVVPVIQEPIVQKLPTHEPWVFTAIDEHNFIISDTDLRELTTYIINLKDYGESGWTWVDYYSSELQRISETFNK